MLSSLLTIAARGRWESVGIVRFGNLESGTFSRQMPAWDALGPLLHVVVDDIGKVERWGAFRESQT